jgi:hypothetical protein
LIKIDSFSKRDQLFKPFSWQVETGRARFKDAKQHSNVMGGVGLTYGDENYFYYFMLNPSLFYRHTVLSGVGMSNGLIYHGFNNLKFGYKVKSEIFSDGLKRDSISGFTTFKISNNWAINLRAEHSYYQGVEDRFEGKIHFYH